MVTDWSAIRSRLVLIFIAETTCLMSDATDRAAGLFGGADPVLRVVGRVERLAPAWVHPMHGGNLPADVLQGYTAALKSLPFTFDGRLFGRHLPDGA